MTTTDTHFATTPKNIIFDIASDIEEIEQDEPTTAPGKPAFAVTDESSANWVVAKIAAIDDESARIKRQHDARQTELKTRREGLLSRFGAELESFAKEEAERRRKKTITLPDGTLSLRTVPGKLIVTNPEEAFAHARTAHPDCIVTASPSLDTAAYLKAATESGEILPGTKYQAAREAFTVKTSGSPKYGAD